MITKVVLMFFISVFISFAGSPRMTLIENLTTSHPNSPGIPSINAQFNQMVQNNSDFIIPINIHRNFNVNEFYNDNPEISKRHFYYTSDAIAVPSFFVNGTLVQNVNLVLSEANKYKNTQSPHTITIVEDRSLENGIFINALIESDEEELPLGTEAFCMLVEGYIQKNVGHPSENQFYFTARNVLPGPLFGTGIFLNKFGFSGVRFYSAINPKWDMSDIYAVVWLQDRLTKQVYQATVTGLNKPDDFPEIIASEDTVKFNTENQNLPQFLDIWNPTSAVLTLEDILIEDDENFTIQFPKEFVLHPGFSLKTQVKMNAKVAGTYETNIIVKSDANTSSELKIPVIGVTDGEQPKATILANKSDINLGTVSSYALDTITINNTGDGILVIEELSFTDPYNGDFSIVNKDFTEIPPKSNKALIIKLAPTQETIYFTDLLIKSNASNGSELFIGITAESENVGNHAHISYDVSELNFGVVNADGNSLSFEVENLGNKNLDLQLSIVNDAFKVYSVENGESVSISPNTSENISVKFMPIESRAYNSRLTINTNDDLYPVVNVALSGIGDIINSIEMDLSGTEIPLSMYPIPAINELNIDISVFNNNLHIQILDLKGRILKDFKNVIPSEIFTIKVEDLTSGAYFVRVSDGKSVYSLEKLLINK